MMTFIIVIHVIACLVLIGLVLIQRGRGAGLVESFSGVESMFGTKTNTFLTRTTTIMSIVFFATCLSLAALSIRQSRSLMTNIKAPIVVPEKQAVPATEPKTQVTEQKPPATQAEPAGAQTPAQPQQKPEGAPNPSQPQQELPKVE